MYETAAVTFPETSGPLLRTVGHAVPRRDALASVRGETRYVDDVEYPRMLHLRMVRSTVHHANIKSVDLCAAAKVPGVVRILTHEDVPNNWFTPLQVIGVSPRDEPVLAVDKVRYRGESIVAVLAESPEAAAAAAARVRVDYEPLPAVFDVEKAMEPGAPVVGSHGRNYWPYEGHHCRRVRLGDVERGFAEADLIVEDRYDTSPIEQAPLETTGCVCAPEADGRFTVHTNTQALFLALANASMISGVPEHRLRFVGGAVGGAFGGKTDCITEPLAVVAAKLTGRPVKYLYSRPEEMQVSSTRAAWRFYIRDGIRKDGRIIARQVRAYADCGAYARHVHYGVTKCAAHLPGPYTIANVHIDVHCVYTNRQPASAMRGFGCTMADFAVEVQMDKVAAAVGSDPWRVRMINAYRDGDLKAHRKKVEGAALIEVLQQAARQTGVALAEDLARMRSFDDSGGR